MVLGANPNESEALSGSGIWLSLYVGSIQRHPYQLGTLVVVLLSLWGSVKKAFEITARVNQLAGRIAESSNLQSLSWIMNLP